MGSTPERTARAAPRRAPPSGPPRLAAGAWIAPLLVVLVLSWALSLTLAVRTFTYSQQELSAAMEADAELPDHVVLSGGTWRAGIGRFLVLGGAFALVALACVVGWLTLGWIKRSWPARYGVTGAAIGAVCPTRWCTS